VNRLRLNRRAEDQPQVGGHLEGELVADLQLMLGTVEGLGRDHVGARSLDQRDRAVDVGHRLPAGPQPRLVEAGHSGDELAG
jgi:hypothetical protein